MWHLRMTLPNVESLCHVIMNLYNFTSILECCTCIRIRVCVCIRIGISLYVYNIFMHARCLSVSQSSCTRPSLSRSHYFSRSRITHMLHHSLAHTLTHACMHAHTHTHTHTHTHVHEHRNASVRMGRISAGGSA